MSDEEEFHASGPKCTSGEGFTRRKTHVGIGVHASGIASGKRASGEVFMRRKAYVGARYASENERRERYVFTRRGRCVPRIVSFSATIG